MKKFFKKYENYIIFSVIGLILGLMFSLFDYFIGPPLNASPYVNGNTIDAISRSVLVGGVMLIFLYLVPIRYVISKHTDSTNPTIQQKNNAGLLLLKLLTLEVGSLVFSQYALFSGFFLHYKIHQYFNALIITLTIVAMFVITSKILSRMKNPFFLKNSAVE